MGKYVSIRAIPAEGHKYRWGGGRSFTEEPVTLEVVDMPIPQVQWLDPKFWDIAVEVRERLENIRLRAEFFSKLPLHQIHVEQLAEIRTDRQLVLIEDVPPPPPPPKSEADVLRERVANLEKQISKKG